jgi:hypothetical protein
MSDEQRLLLEQLGQSSCGANAQLRALCRLRVLLPFEVQRALFSAENVEASLHLAVAAPGPRSARCLDVLGGGDGTPPRWSPDAATVMDAATPASLWLQAVGADARLRAAAAAGLPRMGSRLCLAWGALAECLRAVAGAATGAVPEEEEAALAVSTSLRSFATMGGDFTAAVCGAAAVPVAASTALSVCVALTLQSRTEETAAWRVSAALLCAAVLRHSGASTAVAQGASPCPTLPVSAFAASAPALAAAALAASRLSASNCLAASAAAIARGLTGSAGAGAGAPAGVLAAGPWSAHAGWEEEYFLPSTQAPGPGLEIGMLASARATTRKRQRTGEDEYAAPSAGEGGLVLQTAPRVPSYAAVALECWRKAGEAAQAANRSSFDDPAWDMLTVGQGAAIAWHAGAILALARALGDVQVSGVPALARLSGAAHPSASLRRSLDFLVCAALPLPTGASECSDIADCVARMLRDGAPECVAAAATASRTVELGALSAAIVNAARSAADSCADALSNAGANLPADLLSQVHGLEGRLLELQAGQVREAAAASERLRALAAQVAGAGESARAAYSAEAAASARALAAVRAETDAARAEAMALAGRLADAESRARHEWAQRERESAQAELVAARVACASSVASSAEAASAALAATSAAELRLQASLLAAAVPLTAAAHRHAEQAAAQRELAEGLEVRLRASEISREKAEARLSAAAATRDNALSRLAAADAQVATLSAALADLTDRLQQKEKEQSEQREGAGGGLSPPPLGTSSGIGIAHASRLGGTADRPYPLPSPVERAAEESFGGPGQVVEATPGAPCMLSSTLRGGAGDADATIAVGASLPHLPTLLRPRRASIAIRHVSFSRHGQGGEGEEEAEGADTSGLDDGGRRAFLADVTNVTSPSAGRTPPLADFEPGGQARGRKAAAAGSGWEAALPRPAPQETRARGKRGGRAARARKG